MSLTVGLRNLRLLYREIEGAAGVLDVAGPRLARHSQQASAFARDLHGTCVDGLHKQPGQEGLGLIAGEPRVAQLVGVFRPSALACGCRFGADRSDVFELLERSMVFLSREYSSVFA